MARRIAFGWLVHRQADCLAIWRRQWPVHLAAGAGRNSDSACGWPASLRCSRRIARDPPEARVCTLVRRRDLVLELCRHRRGRSLPVAARPRGSAIVADASYWIYLVHLPIVAAFQVLVGRLPWHWSIKFPLILDREPGAAAGELPLSRAVDVPRAAAERAQVSAIAAGSASGPVLPIVSHDAADGQ